MIRGLVRRAGLRRTHLAAARMCCERHVLSAIGPRRPRDVGRILCYHSVGQSAWGVNDVPPADFRRHIELALSAGWRFVPAAQIARDGGGPKDLAITFDDGLKSVLTHAAPILASYSIPWSVFVVADWSDGRGSWAPDTFLDWRDIEKLAAAGAEVGSHSLSHPNFGVIGAAQTQDELGESRRIIRERSGIDAATFAIPLGQSKNWSVTASQMAREAGYSVVYAQAEETRPAQTVARTFVTRFDGDRIFRALLSGVFDRWEEWV